MAEGDLFTSQKLARAQQRLINLNYFEQGRGHDRTRGVQGQDRRQHRGDREADRPLLDRRRLQLRRTASSAPSTSRSATSSAAAGTCSSACAAAQNLQTGHDRLHRALAVRPAAGRRLRPLQHPARPAPTTRSTSLGGDIRLGHPIGEYSRWNAIYRVSQDKISDVTDIAQPGAPRRGGHRLTSLIGVTPHPRHARQHVRADPRRHRLDQRRLRGRRLRRTSSSGASSPRPTSADLARSRAELRAHGRLPGRLERRLRAAVRALLPGRPELPPQLQVRAGLARGRHRHPDRRQHRVPGQRRVPDTAVLRHRGRGLLRRGQRVGPRHLGRGPASTSRTSATRSGPGFRWMSPFGPIRVDYGINLDRKTGESFGNFQFSVGSSF